MKRRSILRMVVLFVVTLGLYRIYWLYQTKNELSSQKPKQSIPSLVFVIIPFILLVVSVVSLAKTGYDAKQDCLRDVASGISRRACTNHEAFNPADWAITLFYITCAVYVPLQAIFFWGYSKAVSTVTKDRMPFSLAMLLLIVLPYGFDILLIQEAFNETKSKKKSTVHRAATTS